MNGLLTAKQEAAKLGADLHRGAGAAKVLRDQAATARSLAESLTEECSTLEQVVALLQAMQEVWKQRFEQAVGHVVSRGLAAVFEEPLEMVVEMGQSGDLPTARFAVRDGRGLETDVMDARGGGLVNVASFLLRVLLLLAARPPLARILLLDESFVNVSAEYAPQLGELLRRLVDEAAMQILLVTHRPEMADAADVVYRFWLEDGVTKVRAEKSLEEMLAEADGLSA